MLYGVTTLSEIKKRLDAYEMMKAKSQSISSKSSNWNKRNDVKKDKSNPKDDNKSESKNRRCFRCGSNGHDVKACKNELKCFKCNKSGHISKDCLFAEAEKSPNKSNSCNAMVDDDEIMMKNVRILGSEISAQVDTGSPYTLVNLKNFYKIGAPKLNPEKHSCKGVGKGVFETLGSFERQIEIDGKFYSTVIHVVSDDDISYDMIIGKPLLRETGLIFDDAGIQLTKIGGLNSVRIDEIRDDIVDISHLNGTDQQIVREMITTYCPHQIKTTNIDLKILLTKEKEIFQRPRRDV